MLQAALIIAVPLICIFYALIEIYIALTTGRISMKTTIHNQLDVTIHKPTEIEVTFKNPNNLREATK